jgi:hypothetical protein
VTEVPRPPIELLDSEAERVIRIWDSLRDRHQKVLRNYDAIEREITGRYADEGFVVHVNWYRCDPKHQFDHDRQVHEVTSNILGLPGQEGVIKTDQGDAFKNFRAGHGGGHDHSH